MLNVKDKGYLINIVFHCNRINNIISNINKNDFDNNIDYKELLCFNLFQIGELTKKLSDPFIEEYNEMPWKSIKGMRDKIAHDYGAIDYSIVWYTSLLDIPNLHKYCNKILR